MINLPKKSDSSFLGLAKDTATIMQRILTNKKLLKLLYYGDRNWRNFPDLTSEQIKSMLLDGTISIVPNIVIDKEKKIYLRITHDDFMPSASNPYYRDSVIEISIICHFSDWDLGNFEARPFLIAGEIDDLLNETHLSGIGNITLLSGSQVILNEEYGGVVLRYLAVRGIEDKVDPIV